MTFPFDQENPPAAPPPGGGTVAPPPLGPDALGSGANYPDFQGGFRCTICSIDWPVTDPRLFGLAYNHVWEFKATVPCPICEEPMSLFANLFPITVEEAWSKVNHARFRAYFIKHRGWDPEEKD